VKSGSGNLVTCRGLLLFVLPDSSSNQSSNFAENPSYTYDSYYTMF
jgi:hypothetical protein